jgi:alanine racemase
VVTGVSSWRPASLLVDLGAIRRNARRVARRTGTPALFVVKADAYGHGAAAVADALSGEASGRGFVVARPDEGFDLRARGCTAPVLVLLPGAAGLPPAEARELIVEMQRRRLAPGIASREELGPWLGAESTAAGSALEVHCKVDTGLGRAGCAPEELATVIARLRATRHLRLAGVYTHLAESEDLAGGFTALQLDRFEAALALVSGELAGVARHAANTAAALHWPRARYDLVRVGGALYGVDLAAPDFRGELELALRCTARVVQVKRLSPGDSVGYGRRFVARGPREVALLPIGYADGLPTAATGEGAVLLRGRRAAIAGAISMDLASVDVTGLGVQVGDEAVVLGEQGGERIGLDELARWWRSTPYECLCRLSRRLVPAYHDGSEAAQPGASVAQPAGLTARARDR